MNVLIAGQYTDSTAAEFGPRSITLRTQAASDVAKIQPICPLDQEKLFSGKWVDGYFVLTALEEKTSGKGGANATPLQTEIARLKALSDGDLKAAAAEAEVPWDLKASIDTMVKRIAKVTAVQNAIAEAQE